MQPLKLAITLLLAACTQAGTYLSPLERARPATPLTLPVSWLTKEQLPLSNTQTAEATA